MRSFVFCVVRGVIRVALSGNVAVAGAITVSELLDPVAIDDPLAAIACVFEPTVIDGVIDRVLEVVDAPNLALRVGHGCDAVGLEGGECCDDIHWCICCAPLFIGAVRGAIRSDKAIMEHDLG